MRVGARAHTAAFTRILAKARERRASGRRPCLGEVRFRLGARPCPVTTCPATPSPSTGCPRAAASLQQHAWRTAPLVPSSALAPPAGVADPDTGAGTATRPPAARLPLLSTAPSAPVRFTEPLSATFCLPQRRTRARLRDLRGFTEGLEPVQRRRVAATPPGLPTSPASGLTFLLHVLSEAELGSTAQRRRIGKDAAGGVKTLRADHPCYARRC